MLVRLGAIAMSHHGNFSVRAPNTDTVLLTASSSPRGGPAAAAQANLILEEASPDGGVRRVLALRTSVIYSERQWTGETTWPVQVPSKH